MLFNMKVLGSGHSRHRVSRNFYRISNTIMFASVELRCYKLVFQFDTIVDFVVIKEIEFLVLQ